MTRILITGMSGTGKSTVLRLLQQLGFKTVETDETGWCVPEDGDWSQPDEMWILDEARITALLDEHLDRHLFVSATRANQGTFYDRFEHVVVLRAPLNVMLTRVQSRSSNPFGSTIEQRRKIEFDTNETEPLLIRTADLVIDTSVETPKQIADRLIGIL